MERIIKWLDKKGVVKYDLNPKGLFTIKFPEYKVYIQSSPYHKNYDFLIDYGGGNTVHHIFSNPETELNELWKLTDINPKTELLEVIRYLKEDLGVDGYEIINNLKVLIWTPYQNRYTLTCNPELEMCEGLMNRKKVGEGLENIKTRLYNEIMFQKVEKHLVEIGFKKKSISPEEDGEYKIWDNNSIIDAKFPIGLVRIHWVGYQKGYIIETPTTKRYNLGLEETKTYLLQLVMNV